MAARRWCSELSFSFDGTGRGHAAAADGEETSSSVFPSNDLDAPPLS
jgi:hypothetical protein